MKKLFLSTVKQINAKFWVLLSPEYFLNVSLILVYTISLPSLPYDCMYMGEHVSYVMSYKSIKQIQSPDLMYTPREDL